MHKKSQHCTGLKRLYITRKETAINEEKKESGDEYVAVRGKKKGEVPRYPLDYPVSLVSTVGRWEEGRWSWYALSRRFYPELAHQADMTDKGKVNDVKCNRDQRIGLTLKESGHLEIQPPYRGSSYQPHPKRHWPPSWPCCTRYSQSRHGNSE